MEGLSRNAGQPAQVDNPEQSLNNPRQRRDEYMGQPIEAYEREIATQSWGLVRGKCAWCHGKETWLVDLPLVILESIRDVLAQRGCRVPRLRSPLYLFTAYLAGANAVAGHKLTIFSLTAVFPPSCGARTLKSFSLTCRCSYSCCGNKLSPLLFPSRVTPKASPGIPEVSRRLPRNLINKKSLF